MRVVLTSLAVALVAALFVALVAPLFVDWSSHRADIAARLSALTGGQVTLAGPITAQLLPTPFFEVGEGSVTGPTPDAPKLTFASARLELALVKLMSGKIRFNDIRLDKPVLTLSRRPDGSLDLPKALPLDRAGEIGFDRLVVTNGQITMAEAGGSPAQKIERIAFTADAPSLAGPFRVVGSFAGPGGEPVGFRAATQKQAGGRTPLRLSVDPGKSWPALEFDGAIEGAAIAGSASVIGAASGPEGEVPWRASGTLIADVFHAALNPVEIRFGPEERAVRAEGSARLGFGEAARLNIELKAKQANLDALLRKKGEDAAAPVRALSLASTVLAPIFDGARPLAVEARLSAGQTILGGDTLPGLSASLSASPDSALAIGFDFVLPGNTRFKGDGRLEPGPAAKFVGTIDASSDEFGIFRSWAGAGAPRFAARASAFSEALPYHSLRLAGPVEISAVGISGQKVTLTLGRSTLIGSVAFTAPVGSDRGRLFLDLSSPSLDVAKPPDLPGSMSLVDDLDLSLSLSADALHVADLSDGPIDTGPVFLTLTKTGPEIRLERLSISNLGGASVDAAGASGLAGVTLAGHVRADRLRDFATLISRLTSKDWTRLAAERADLLMPAVLAFEAHGAASQSVTSFAAKGTLARTEVALNVEPGPRDSGQAIALAFDAPDVADLLRQFGLSAARSARTGRAHVAIDASGDLSNGYDVNGAAILAGTNITGRGRFLPEAQGEDARLFGSLKVSAANVSPLLAAFGVAPLGDAIGSADVGADVTLRGAQWTISRLAGTVAGVKVKGELTYRAAADVTGAAAPDISRAIEALGGGDGAAGQQAPPLIGGRLSLDHLSFGSLAGLVLGPLAPPKADTVWSDAKFAAPLISVPPASIALSVGVLDLTGGVVAHNFKARLELDKGALDLTDVDLALLGGSLNGRATIRRNGEAATLSGALTGARLAIRRPGFAGEAAGAIEFASTGRSPAALIAGLAGSGSARFAGAQLARSDLSALDRVVADAQAPDAQLDETKIAFDFGNELDKAPAILPDASAPLALSAGALKIGPLALSRPQGEASLTATFDLRRLSLETRLTLVSPLDKLKFWSGPPPAASATVQNALDAPKRKVEVGALSAGLATQAIARESDRIANLEADIRERAFFNRRLKGLEFLDRRQRELEDWLAEQARLTGLSQRLRAEREEEARLAAEKAAAEKAVAERAEQERKAAAERTAVQPELPPELPAPEGSARPEAVPPPSPRSDEVSVEKPHPPPARSKTAPAQDRAPPPPTAGSLY